MSMMSNNKMNFRLEQNLVLSQTTIRRMLAQRSPKWICRICLNIQTRSHQSRKLTQISDPSTNPAENNVAQISPHGKELPIRRVPLRELLNAKRKAEET